jgi:hypothetical protein
MQNISDSSSRFGGKSMQGPLRGIIAGIAAWKLGGGCISTILIFILVYYFLGKSC